MLGLEPRDKVALDADSYVLEIETRPNVTSWFAIEDPDGSETIADAGVLDVNAHTQGTYDPASYTYLDYGVLMATRMDLMSDSRLFVSYGEITGAFGSNASVLNAGLLSSTPRSAR